MPRSLTPWVLALALAACRAPNAKLDVAPADGGTDPAREDLSQPQPGDLAALPGTDLATSEQAADLSTPIAHELAVAGPDLATAPPQLRVGRPTAAGPERLPGVSHVHPVEQGRRGPGRQGDPRHDPHRTQTKSSECPTAFFVKPGDANASYLYQKINGTGSCFVGASMPLGAPLLTPTERGIIRDWINAGALPN